MIALDDLDEDIFHGQDSMSVLETAENQHLAAEFPSPPASLDGDPG